MIRSYPETFSGYKTGMTFAKADARGHITSEIRFQVDSLSQFILRQ